MSNKKIEEFKNEVGRYAANKIPFLFLLDYEMKKPFVCSLDDAKGKNIYFDVNGNTNYLESKLKCKLKVFRKYPISKREYLQAIKFVQAHLNRGDSYLVNLTFKSKIKSNCSLKELFTISQARYRLFFKDKFIVFSPECFIKINNNKIYSYPMKGTIDADIPKAAERLLNSKKEIFEHNTIVDLIRNDISIIAKDVQVTKFRYIDKIFTNQKNLLQVSSEIKGRLPDNWRKNLGEMLIRMMPAGSISGAPKQRTVEIIRETEKDKRGYYTGIFGIFDGNNLDSAVNIRYIEKSNDNLYFRSGGGITALSDPETEYKELIDKIYVPIG